MAFNQKGRSKKGRIVVRNLSYKAGEDEIVEYFKPFGEIVDFNILKFEDGRIKGVAFIEYNNLLSAMKAIKERNLKRFLGRLIAVDLAVSKQRYKTNLISNGHDIKAEPDIKVEPDIKIEPDIKVEPDVIENKYLHGSDPIPPDKIKKEKNVDVVGSTATEMEDKKFLIKKGKIDPSVIKILDEEGGDDDDFDDNDESSDDIDNDCEEDDDDDSVDDDDDDDGGDGYEENQNKGKIKDPNDFARKSTSNDILEGRTVFIRNISFQSNEDEVRAVLSHFGKLKNVVFCRDSDSGRFRGTAFAQFVDSSSCTKCLESFEDPFYRSKFRVGDRSLIVIAAVGRDEIAKKLELKNMEKEKIDKRNLFLAREGVIRGGTKAAIGVSKSDLVLRTIREKIKRKMLVNFNHFISPTRLFVCNLPFELTDKELKDIFIKYSPKGAVVNECRIMRNLFKFDDKGRPVSKGHGFVNFTEHSHALEALRNVNNNPEIFTINKRPVVEFSMENKAALQAKERRMKKSKEGNVKNISASQNLNVSSTSETNFMGSKYDPKKKGMKAFHSHIGPKIRHRDTKNKKKLSRNKINDQVRNSLMVKRRKKKVQTNKSTSKKAIKNQKSSHLKKDNKKSKGKLKKRKFIQ